MSRDLPRPHNQCVMWIHGQEPIKMSYDPAKFGGHRHSGSGYGYLCFPVPGPGLGPDPKLNLKTPTSNLLFTALALNLYLLALALNSCWSVLCFTVKICYSKKTWKNEIPFTIFVIKTTLTIAVLCPQRSFFLWPSNEYC